jgi:signal transduction histidine kinase
LQARTILKRWLGLEKFTFERFMHLAIFLGLPIMLGVEFLFLPELEHYAGVRLIFAFISLAIFFASFKVKFIQNDFTYINYVVIYLVISHLIFLTYVNNFTFFQSALLIALILGASLVFRTRTQLGIFQVCMFFLVLQASFLAMGDTEVDVLLFLGLYIFMNVVAFSIQDYIFRQRDKLEIAAENLQRSNRSLEQFAYVASHDLQEPLRTVTNYVQLLQRRYGEKLDEDADEFIFFAVDATRRMQNLIQSLLKFSRVSSDNLKRIEIDLNDIMDNVASNLEINIKENNAVINYPMLPEIMGDRTMITQLFQNLIGNSIKYRNEADPVITIDSERSDNVWQFSVKDNGIGIPDKYQERVFTIFNRVNAQEGAPQGSGIGLAICKRIAMNHGGELWLESKEGEGSTFYFTIAKP